MKETKPVKTGKGKNAVVAVLAVLLIIVVAVATMLIVKSAVKKNTKTEDTAGAVSSAEETDSSDSSAMEENSEGEVYYNGAWYAPKDNLETILFMGIDKFEDDMEEQQEGYINSEQADFNLVVVIDHDTGTCQALQLNRDTMCEMKVLGATGDVAMKKTAQLALAHTYGSGGSDSCINAKDAVSNLLYGMTIDHYVAMSMDAVPIINDAVGGVTLACMDDLTFVDPALIEGEEITLVGDQALLYVRTRKGLEDSTNLHRMERQQQYMLALWKLVSEKAAEDSNFLAKLMLNVSSYIQTDCSTNQMQEMFDTVSQLDVDEILTPDGDNTKGEEYMEFYVDDDSMQELVISLFYEEVK